ncbi:MAG: universal stress protein [Desulfosarcina sp.]|nr:universal stress protein [Desulfobacterales bacterium]
MLFEPQHIVCAVDFSIHTEKILRWGNHLARIFDARLSVFHAVNASHDRFPGTAIFERGGPREAPLKAAYRRLKELSAPFDRVYDCKVAAGDPVEALVAFTRKTPTDLVMAAGHGLSGFQRILLDTVVERMARQLEQPLLVVRLSAEESSGHLDFKKVVVACDSATTPVPALGLAAVWARRFDAVLHLLHAMELPVMADMLEPTDGPYGEVQAALQHRLHDNMAKMMAAAGFDAAAVTIDLQPGPAAEVLPPYLRDQQADLLVVGVRPHRRLQQFLIGSTTEAALRKAPCAVLTVPTMTNQG